MGDVGEYALDDGDNGDNIGDDSGDSGAAGDPIGEWFGERFIEYPPIP